MIRNIFLPTRIANYYLFATRILAIEITSLYVKGVVLVCVGSSKQLEKTVCIDIKELTENSLIASLKKIIAQVKKYDLLICDTGVLPVIFKELTVPFIGKEKIDMMLGFEVESYLPFALADAAFDSMVLAEYKEKQESRVLIACVQKDPLYDMLHAFEKAGCSLEQVGVTLFGLYQMYTDLLCKDGLVIDFGIDATRVLYFNNGDLQAMRQIPKGIKDALDLYHQEQIQHTVIYPDFMQSIGMDDERYQSFVACKKIYYDMVLPEVAFAISSFQRQLQKDFKQILQVTVQGFVDDALVQECKSILQLEDVQLFSVEKLKDVAGITVQGLEVSDMSAVAMLLGNYRQDINLLQPFLQEKKVQAMSNQLLTLLLVTMFTLGGVFGYSYYLLGKWKDAYALSKKELDRALMSQMNISPIQLKQHRQLQSLEGLAFETLQREKKLWFAFSAQAELSYLDYLYELSTTIDRQSLDLTVSRLDLNLEEVVLHGHVKDYDALKTFEEELLRLKNFTIVDVPRELTFIVKLKVKNGA